MADKAEPDVIKEGDRVKIVSRGGNRYGRVVFMTGWGAIAIVNVVGSDKLLICVTDQLIKVDESTNVRDNDGEKGASH